MNILLISRGYPTEKYKMNGIFEFDQARALVKEGHNVILAVIDVRSFRRKRKWGFESLNKDGVQIEVINIPCGRIPEFILNNVRIWGLKKLYENIKSKYGKPDIIHAHFLQYGYVSTCVFAEKQIPLVLTEHLSAMNQKILNSKLMRLGKKTYSKMGKVITVSNPLAENIKEKFGVEAVVIPNIVDTTSFIYKDKKTKNNSFNFVSTGGLIERKGMNLLIEAFNIAFKGNNEVKLYIYGEGPERNKLEKLIREYQLAGQIYLMGLVDRKEIANKMSESDCFILVSRLETFGVVYIEAMAMGLPVIATRCGGPEDFVNKENGILIPNIDINEIAKSMRYLYQNIDRYDKKRISDIAKDKFSSKSIARKLVQIYEESIEECKRHMI